MPQIWTAESITSNFSAHASQWDDLCNSTLHGHPLLQSSYIGCLLKYFGSGTEQLCMLRRGGELQCMLIVSRKRFGIWTLFLPAQAQIGTMVGKSIGNLQSLFTAISGWAAQIDLLCLDEKYIEVNNSEQCAAEVTPHAQTMCVDLIGSFDDYWTARPKKLRSNMKRYEKRLNTDGIATRFVQIRDEIALTAAIDRYAELESRGWKGRNGTALAPGNTQHRFFSEAARLACRSGGAVVYELWFGDKLAASRLMIWSGSICVMLKTTYDETLSSYAPGRLLLLRVIEALFQTHAGKVLEFYTNATQDQLAWATEQRPIQHYTLFSSRLVQGMRQALKSLGQRLTPATNATAVPAPDAG